MGVLIPIGGEDGYPTSYAETKETKSLARNTPWLLLMQASSSNCSSPQCFGAKIVLFRYGFFLLGGRVADEFHVK